MKNPLLHFKEKEHQQAFYAVAIFIMLSILFFLLVSLKTPVKEEISVAPTETLIEISFDDTPATMGDASASASNPVPVSAPDIAVQADPSLEVQKSAASQVDNTFDFNATSGTTDGTTFGKSDGPNMAESGLKESENSDRAILKNPKFEANLQEEGRIALKLWVDANGFVVRAILDTEQSNSGSHYLIDEATKAAKTMRYSTKPGVHSEYVGTKIFSFKKS